MSAIVYSIVIPVYNVASYLRECLDSVLAQTFADWEAICVDDGSTDGSGAILDEYAAKDGRFKVIHQTNSGVSAARNAGLKFIRGDWFLFLDADDMLRPQALSNFESVLRKHPEVDGVLVHPYIPCWDGGAVPPECINPDVLVENATCEDLFLGPYAANGFPFSRLYRRSKFGCLTFRTDMHMGEDVCFWFDVLGVHASWVIVYAEYYLYRQRIDSVCGAKNPHNCVQSLESILYALNSIRKNIDPTGDTTSQYLHRFPYFPVEYLGLAIKNRTELSKEEWLEIVASVRKIEAISGSWPWGGRLKLMTRMAAARKWKWVFEPFLMMNDVYLFLRHFAGSSLRRLGLRK